MIIGLGHQARVGKDTVGQILCRDHGFTRVSFAAPVYQVVTDMNPLLTYSHYKNEPLDSLVDQMGWEWCKGHTDVRDLLIGLGAGMRKLDPNVWVRIAEQKIWRLAEAKGVLPHALDVVVTDMRYRNEATMLRQLGGKTVDIHRPWFGAVHPDEHELDDWNFDYWLVNDGCVEDLEGATQQMLKELSHAGAT